MQVDVLTGGGGGTQYTSGDIDATPTGTVAMWYNSSDSSLNAAGDLTPLPVVVSSIESIIEGIVYGLEAHDAVDAGTAPVKIGGYAKASAPADVSADADRVNAWFLRNGAQAVNLTAAGALIGGDATNGIDVDVTRVGGTVAVTQSGTWDEVGINDSGNSITVDYATTGSGTATGALRVELPTNGTGTVGLNAGTNAIGKLAANSGVDIGDVDVTSISAGTNKIGDVDISPRTTGGWSVGNYTSGDTYTALTATAQVIKASAGKFGGYYIYNPNAAATYVEIYNIAAASVTVGTSTAKLVFCIPASSGANLEILAGIPFDTAMSIAATTTGGGNTAPTTALEAMVFYL